MEKNDPPPKAKQSRGRPRGGVKSQVMQRLLETTVMLLRENSHHDLTERKIAEVAGTNVAMIHYYFGDKNGLVFGVIDNYFDEVSEKLEALEAIDSVSKHATREIIKIIVGAYYSKYWIASIAMSEFSRNKSSLRTLFMNRFGPRGMGLARLQKTIQRLVECGTYDHRINVTYAAIGLITMIMAPLTMASFYEGLLALNQLENDDWIDYVADLYDHHLLAGKTAA